MRLIVLTFNLNGRIIVTHLNAHLINQLQIRSKKMHKENSSQRIHDDWHRQDILSAVRKRGVSLAALSRKNGYASTTLQNALDRHVPEYERIIADFIGEKPSVIWPSRYQKSDSSIFGYKNDPNQQVA